MENVLPSLPVFILHSVRSFSILSQGNIPFSDDPPTPAKVSSDPSSMYSGISAQCYFIRLLIVCLPLTTINSVKVGTVNLAHQYIPRPSIMPAICSINVNKEMEGKKRREDKITSYSLFPARLSHHPLSPTLP